MVFLVCGVSNSAAQEDAFGEIDLLYVDSVEAGPGQDVAVHFNLQNDESLRSFSIPITYDAQLLELKSISFADSRCSHIGTRLIAPDSLAEANGHFMVSVATIFEDPITPGDGLLFTVLFGVSDSAVPGTVTAIDSLFYPPGGSLLLVEDSSLVGIRPNFDAGKVVVREQNRQPVFAAVSDQYVFEGNTLELDIAANDPDGDPVTLAVTSKPTGAVFVDNGDGTARLSWTPDFVGPYSSDGSPYTVSFWASDGDLATEKTIAVSVINQNRRPTVTAPEEVVLGAGEYVSFTISAVDPDFEETTISLSGMPEGSEFDGNNPGLFEWSTQMSDSGSRVLEIIASDPLGYADTCRVTILVSAATVYALTLDTISAMPNESVSYGVLLDNQLPVASFNLLINYDASALALQGVTNAGTRSEDFEYFNVVYDENGFIGNVRVIGVADQTGGGVPPLASGEGRLASFEFRVSGDLAFAGISVPVRFRFLDPLTQNDNTLTDEAGEKISQDEIIYTDGSVRIRELGEIKIGDINLNGLAFEISDVIYFTNYFMNPLLYSFDPVQFANSDVNQDNLAATVADLVYLINVVTSGGMAPKTLDGDGDLEAVVGTSSDGGTVVFSYETDYEVGGILLTLAADREVDYESLQELTGEMVLDFHQEDDEVKVLLYSLDGAVMPAGSNDFLTIEDLANFEIKAVDLATFDGRYVSVVLKDKPQSLPAGYVLHQNYPNPFNPETRIEFELPVGGSVELTVFNLLGQQVKTLASGYFPAGNHEAEWDGRDHSGSKVSSGVYLYRLEAEGLSVSKKMVLLK